MALLTAVSSHWPCFPDLEMRAVVRLGERAARKVTARGVVILAGPACTYTCTPSLIFLSFRCSDTPFKSSPFVCNLGSFCPNIDAFKKKKTKNSVLSAYVVVFLFFCFLARCFFLVCDRAVWICILSLLLVTNLTWHVITKGIPPPPSSKRLDGYKSSDHGLNLFRIHGISPQGNLNSTRGKLCEI